MQKKRHKHAGRRRPTKPPELKAGKVATTRQDFIPEVNIKASEARKKPRLEAILFCDYANRLHDGKLILSGCFDRIIFSAEEDKISIPFFLFIRTMEATEGFVQVSLIDPNETIVLAFQLEVGKLEFMPDMPAQVDFLQRLQFPVPYEGYYWFDVSYNGESIGGSALAIEYRKPEVKKDEHEAGSTTPEPVGT